MTETVDARKARDLGKVRAQLERERSAQLDTSSAQWQERCIVFMIVRVTIENNNSDRHIKSVLSRTWPKERIEHLWSEADALWRTIFTR